MVNLKKIVIFEENIVIMENDKQNILTDQEFLDMIGRAYQENEEILTVGSTNEGIQEAIEDVNEYYQIINETYNSGKITINNQCIINA